MIDIQFERELLHGILCRAYDVKPYVSKMTVEWFEAVHLRIIFSVIKDYFNKSFEVPQVDILLNELKKNNKIEKDELTKIEALLTKDVDVPEGRVKYLYEEVERAYLARTLRISIKKALDELKGGDPRKARGTLLTSLTDQGQDIWVSESLPASLSEFMKQDIPPVEYYISGLLPELGKGIISGLPNVCKTIAVQNLALSMACGRTKVMDKFDVSPAKVLYLDFEMGESAVKERFQKMQTQVNLPADNLFVKSLPSIDLLNSQDKQLLEGWLKGLKIDVLIIDPLGHAWVGNENDQGEVRRLTAYLNELIAKFGISVLLIHHWRKNTKGHNSGGQMAAGSYRWEAWTDCHVTLEGNSSSVTVSSQKNRHRPKFTPFIVKLNEENLWLEYVADYAKRFDESDLTKLFNSFNTDRVAIPALIAKAKAQKICSGGTLRKLINARTQFDVDKSAGKTHYLVRKIPKA